MTNFVSPPIDQEQEKDNQDKIPDKKPDYVADLLDSSRLQGNIDQIINPRPEAAPHPQVEQGSTPERAPETMTPASGAEILQPQTVTQPVVSAQPVARPAVVDPEIQEIEGILSEGMEDVYKNLDPQTKQRFRQKGEETANLIKNMAYSVKFTFKWLVGILTSWLMIIPGANKFFLEQEAKIKADSLINWKAKKK